MKILGAVLIVLGLAALIYGGIRWTERDTVLDVGPLNVTTEERHGVAIPPVIGAACLVGGVLLLVANRRRLA